MDAIGPGERERVDALRRFQILNTAGDRRFDRIVQLAREHLGMPIALISFVDEQRQWFKANLGFPMDETPRVDALCAHAIQSDEPLIVPDTTQDPRFTNNRLVRGDPYIRFYAGAPLTVARGIRLGTLCVMDLHPRTLSAEDTSLLCDLAAIVVDQLHLRQARAALEEALGRRRAQDELLEQQKLDLWKQERLLQQASRLARIGGWEYDPATDHIMWSDEVYRLHELPRSYRPRLEDLHTFYPGEGAERFKAIVADALTALRGYEFELPFVSAKGTRRTVRAIGEVQAQGGKAVRLFGSLQDVTDLRRAQERVEFLSQHDPLTGLPNRTAFQERLERAIVRPGEDGDQCALLLVDLDNLRDFNEMTGHDAGDALLQVVGQRLRDAAKGKDFAARLGGDQFAVILTGLASRRAAETFAAGLRAALARPFGYGGEQLSVSASIGVAMHPRDAASGDDLLRNAEIALSVAKHQGRNCYVFFDNAMRAEVEKRLDALASIRTALAAGELTPYYQPIVSFEDGRLIGFEALLRWVKDTGLVAVPAAYMAALEDPALSEAIGTHMIEAAIEQIAAWDEKGISGFRVGINVASSQFRGGRLASAIIDRLDAARVDPRRLAIEVTETVLLSRQSGEVAQTLEDLRACGIRIALDDFGTGYASLTHLLDFPVDTIKIDKSFVQSLLTSEESRTIVEAIVNLSHSLGKQTIAEGVERVEQGALLKALGCDWGQGYLIGRAMPADRAEDYILQLREETAPAPDRQQVG